MRTREFFNRDQADNYLINSIIRFNERPVMITEVSGGGGKKGFVLRGRYCDPNAADSTSFYHKDLAVNMEPIPLGFLVLDHKSWLPYTAYISRLPVRAWKIGLTRNHTAAQSMFYPEISNLPTSMDHLIHSREMDLTVLNKYLSIPDAIKLANSPVREDKFTSGYTGYRVIPISRNLAVGTDKKVFYKYFGDPIGEVDKNGAISLEKDKAHLQECVEKDVKG